MVLDYSLQTIFSEKLSVKPARLKNLKFRESVDSRVIVTEEPSAISYMVAAENGDYQTVTVNFEVNLKNSTIGNTLERLLEIKSSNVTGVTRLPSIINRGNITGMVVQSTASNKIRVVLSDDKGSVHIIDNSTLVKSISVSSQPIVGLEVNNLGTVYFASKRVLTQPLLLTAS